MGAPNGDTKLNKHYRNWIFGGGGRGQTIVDKQNCLDKKLYYHYRYSSIRIKLQAVGLHNIFWTIFSAN